MPYPPSRVARVSPTGPAPTISTSVSKGFVVEPFWDAGGVIVWSSASVAGVGWVMSQGGGSAAQQEVEVDLVERLGVLVLRPVTAVLHHRELRAGNLRGDPLRFGDRAGRVLRRPQHEGRGLDLAEGFVGEHVPLADLQVLQRHVRLARL